MAGAFTHMAIVAEAKARLSPSTEFGNIFRRKLKFVTMGSVSPDIPYLSHLELLGVNWADIMHYHSTNGIVHNGLHTLRVTKDSGEYWIEKLAWLAGFVSHLVADATIHPIVEAIVGPCTDPKTMGNHTECEMTQDVLVFETRNQELRSAEYTDHLLACKRDAAFSAVLEFWAEHAKVNCPSAGTPGTKGMFDRYFLQMDAAEGGYALAAAFRHIGITYAYKSAADLRKDKTKLNRYFEKVKLPNGGTGAFMTEGFARAVQNTVDIWNKMDRYLFSTDNVAEIVPNWNLDTGIDQDTNKRTYWG
ncbi:MAG: zinc dependent phospholipase C family protein [Bacteroidetes bacterium]|nr:zinc dependent phospholipase C family protein [Bacteroidota bacterium]